MIRVDWIHSFEDYHVCGESGCPESSCRGQFFKLEEGVVCVEQLPAALCTADTQRLPYAYTSNVLTQREEG